MRKSSKDDHLGYLPELIGEPLVPAAPGGSGLRATQSNTIQSTSRILRQSQMPASLALLGMTQQ